MKSEKPSLKLLKTQKIIVWVLFFALLLLLARIGTRHYFRDTPVKPGTFTVTIGRVFAQWAVALMLLQSLLAARIRFLDRLFGLDRLLLFHRASGLICFFFATFHPMLMYLSGLKKAGPLALSQWPEAIGGICVVGLWFAVVSSVWRKFVELSYQQWLIFHKITASVVFLALAHMFIIESAMRKGWMLGFWLVLLALWAGTIVAVRFVLPRMRAGSESYVVSSTGPAADNVLQLSLKSALENPDFNFLPGQFAFVSFENPLVAGEEHPFTIASAPDDKATLQFLIKESGDWTKSLHAVKVGDKVRVVGPFGVFSPFRHEANSLTMIAGGIGITPMLSVLRQLVNENSQMPVKLVWSYKTSAEAPCYEEFESFRKNLSNFDMTRIVTRESKTDKRLDLENLKKLLPEYRPGHLVMLCGPLVMMKDVRRHLLEYGYPDSAIINEEFAF